MPISKNDSKGIKTISRGIDFSEMLTVLFVGLKLTGYVNWSWFWVISPLLIEFGISLLIILIVEIYEWHFK